MVVEEHEVFDSATGSDGETTCLVRGNIACYFDGLKNAILVRMWGSVMGTDGVVISGVFCLWKGWR